MGLVALLSAPSLELWLAVASIALGIATSAYFYHLGRREKAPRHRTSSVSIIDAVGPEVGDIEVRYKGRAIGNLRAATVTLWNAGRDPIRSQDVASDAPLTIALPSGNRLLQATIDKVSNPLNKFRIERVSQNAAVLAFEFFGRDEGATLKLLYAGDAEVPLVSGHVIGVGDVREALESTRARDASKLLAIPVPIAAVFGWVAVILPILDLWESDALLATLAKLAVALGGLIAVGFGAAEAAASWAARPMEPIPSALAAG